jgi:sugar phosphate isomerase/epimerase
MSLKSALVKSAVAVALSSAATACSTVGSPAAKCGGVDPVKIGACSWSFRKPVSELDAEMRKAGVKGIQLALGPFIEADGRHGDAEGAESLTYVKAKIASGEWKLMSTMISFPQEDYTTLETIRKTGGIVPDECWEKNRRMISEAAKLTRELGAKYLLTHAGFLDESDEKAYKKYVERVSWVRDECRRHGVEIILETGQETADDLVKFLNHVPGLGVNFDPANMILYGKGDPIAGLRKLMPWIRSVHVKDACATKTPGTWGTEVPWGEGEVGADMFVSELKRLGYKGHYVVERENGDNRTADIALAVKRLQKK